MDANEAGDSIANGTKGTARMGKAGCEIQNPERSGQGSRGGNGNRLKAELWRRLAVDGRCSSCRWQAAQWPDAMGAKIAKETERGRET